MEPASAAEREVPAHYVRNKHADIAHRAAAMRSSVHANFGIAWPYAIAGLAAIAAKLPTLTNGIVFIDEPAYLVEAQRLDSLRAFLFSAQYLSETKLQLGLVPYMAAMLISALSAILIVHMLGLIAIISSALLIVAISQRAFNTPVPALFSVAGWALFLNRDIQTAATVLEVFQTPLVLLACWQFILALQRRVGSTRKLFWVGFFVGLAALVKPPGAALLPVMCAVLLVSTRVEMRLSKQAILASLQNVVVLIAGVCLPVLIFLLPYLFDSQALGALRYNLFDLTNSYAGTSTTSGFIYRLVALLVVLRMDWVVLVAVSAIVSLLGSLHIIRNRRRNHDSTHQELCQYLLLGSGLALLVAYSMGQNKHHYLIPVVPFLLLFTGYRVWLIYRQLSNPLLRIVFAEVLLLWVGYFELDSAIYYRDLLWDNGRTYAAQMPDIRSNDVIRYIKANTTSTDYIWVYYNAPEIYWLSGRKPATDEPSGTWLVDYYDQSWFDRTYRQLESEQPKLIIGLNKPRYERSKVSNVTSLPEISKFIQSNFVCNDQIIDNVTLCKHK